MAKRPITAFVKHHVAMQLILTMESGLDGDQRYPNVDFVRKNKTPPKVKKFPADKKYEWIKYCRDMLPLVEPKVYEAFHQMLRSSKDVGGLTVNRKMVHQAANFNAAILQRTTDIFQQPLWEGPPPHGCYWIMREVIIDLLS
jgi:hypothetical protein